VGRGPVLGALDRKMNTGGRRGIVVRATGGGKEKNAATWSVEGVPIPLKFIVDDAAAVEPNDENEPDEVKSGTRLAGRGKEVP